MIYKKTIQDKQINKEVRKRNVAEVARRMKVSKSYMHMALKDNFKVSEDFYMRLKKVLKEYVEA